MVAGAQTLRTLLGNACPTDRHLRILLSKYSLVVCLDDKYITTVQFPGTGADTAFMPSGDTAGAGPYTLVGAPTAGMFLDLKILTNSPKILDIILTPALPGNVHITLALVQKASPYVAIGNKHDPNPAAAAVEMITTRDDIRWDRLDINIDVDRGAGSTVGVTLAIYPFNGVDAGSVCLPGGLIPGLGAISLVEAALFTFDNLKVPITIRTTNADPAVACDRLSLYYRVYKYSDVDGEF